METNSNSVNTDNKTTEILETKKTLNSNKKVIWGIVIGIIIITCIVLCTLYIVIKPERKNDNDVPIVDNNNDNDNNTNPEITIDYQKIINQYGEQIEHWVNLYYTQYNKLPSSLDFIAKVTKIKGYQISCENKNIYENQKIYLSECTINNSTQKYSYGKKEELVVEQENVTIYRSSHEGFYGSYDTYTTSCYDNSCKEYAVVPCKNGKCTGVYIFSNNAIIKNQDGNYSIYDYQKKDYLDIVFKSVDYNALISNQEKLYGVYFEENNKKNIYNVESNKKIKLNSDIYSFPTSELLLSNKIVPLQNGDFISIETGDIVYHIDDVVHIFEDDETKKIYLFSGSYGQSNYQVYDSKGNSLFNGIYVNNFYANNDTFAIVKDNIFEIYDSKYQKIYTSKRYDEVLSIWKDYILVIDNQQLNLVDYQGNKMTTFIENWNNETNRYHSMLSGWYTENGKNGIYIIVADQSAPNEEILKNNPDMTLEELNSIVEAGLGKGYEYYYIPTTKESGRIATYIGSYAKPVLYLYPMITSLVNVTFANPTSLTTTYPKYENGWNVLANSNGDLRDLKGKYYYGLYWEENGNHFVDFEEGFYVTKNNAVEFLEEKLTYIGLNDRERNEFIMYWLPILEKNEKSVVYFELTEERNLYSPINIVPKPTSLLRLAIHVKKVDKEPNIRQQKLPNGFERKGFTAVEWGGVNYIR